MKYKKFKISSKVFRLSSDNTTRILPLTSPLSKETVRKIRKNSVENTARDLSICDNLAAGVFFRILAGKKTIFKRKRHVSGQNHLH